MLSANAILNHTFFSLVATALFWLMATPDIITIYMHLIRALPDPSLYLYHMGSSCFKTIFRGQCWVISEISSIMVLY